MKFILLTLFLVSFVTFCVSQEEVLTIKNTNLTKSIKNKDSYAFSDEKTGGLIVLIREKNDLFAYLYDDKLNKINEIKTSSLKRKFKEFLGFQIEGDNYNLFFTNTSKKKYAIINYNFITKTSNTWELEFNHENEKYLEVINNGNKLYLLSANNNNTLIIRELKNNKLVLLKTFNLIAPKRKQKLLRKGTNQFSAINLFESLESKFIEIDNRAPISIEQSSKKNKLYNFENKIYLTFETKSGFTLMYIIDLNTLTIDNKVFSYPISEIEKFKKYNSFLFKNIFFHFASSNEEMKFQIKDLNDFIKKEFHFNKSQEITIKNSPIIQEGSFFESDREFEKTSKFLRKISAGNLGVAIYKVGNTYQVTLGGVRQVTTTSSGYVAGYSTPITTGQGVPFQTFNPTYYNYNNYSFTKSTFIHSLFDVDFNHIDDKIKDNIFDKIKKFENRLKNVDAINVFFHNNILYFGFLDIINLEYNIYKFTN